MKLGGASELWEESEYLFDTSFSASSLQDEANFSEGQNTLSDSSANPINKSVTSLEYQGVVGGGGVTHPRKSRGKSEGDVWKSSAVKEKKWEEEELSSLMESSPGRLKRSGEEEEEVARNIMLVIVIVLLRLS